MDLRTLQTQKQKTDKIPVALSEMNGNARSFFFWMTFIDENVNDVVRRMSR